MVERSGGRAVDVDPQDLAEQGRLPLTVVRGIARATAVTGADVQVAVRAEGQRAAVVVGVGAVLDQQHRSGAALDDVGVRTVGREARHHDVAAVARVVDVEPAVGHEVGVEGQTEQTALAAVLDLRADVHEEARLERRHPAITLIVPRCSTTNSRFVPSRALVIWVGESKPPAT